MLTQRALWRDALTIASFIYLAWVWLYLLNTGSHVDVAAYWRAAQGQPYAISHAGTEDAFLYSPVVAQVLSLIAALPMAWFVGGLLALSLGALVYLVGPWIAALTLITPLPFVWQDLSSGNIHILLAAAIVVGFRYPAAWSFVLLTKVTPGIGLLWFAVRQEWTALLTAVGVTALLALTSLAVAPNLWREWSELLISNSSATPAGVFVPGPLWLRVVLGSVLVVWGARTNRAWIVPVAAMLALPVIWVYDGFAILLGAVSILRHPPDVTGQGG